MNDQERDMIEGLFTRLRQAESHSGPRDRAAEGLIRQRMAEQPGADYLLAQVVLVQEEGLRQLQQRVEQLERDLAARPQTSSAGGFLGGLFGAAPSPPPPPQAKSSGWSNSAAPGATRPDGAPAPTARPGSAFANAPSGGFLAGAMQTAMGVAGGLLLGNALAGLFASDAAEAAQAPAPDQAPDDPVADEERPLQDVAETPPESDEGGFFGGFFDGGFDGGDEF